MEFQIKDKSKEDNCYYDSILKTMIHKFKLGATKCECEIIEVKPRSDNHGWRNNRGK